MTRHGGGGGPNAVPLCPICATPLRSADRAGVVLHECSGHGTWLPKESLQKALRHTVVRGRTGGPRWRTDIRDAHEKGFREGRGQYEGASVGRRHGRTTGGRSGPKPEEPAVRVPGPGSRSVPRPCPECGVPMACEVSRDNWRETPDVDLDRCRAHGTWFDAGELEVLRRRACLDAQREVDVRKRRARADGLREGGLARTTWWLYLD